MPGRRFDVTVRFDKPVHADPACEQRTAPQVHVPGAELLARSTATQMRVTILQTDPDPLVIGEIVFIRRRSPPSVHRESAKLLDTLRIGVG